MSASAKWFGHGPTSGYDWAADTIKVALLDETFTPDQDSQQFLSDVSVHEVANGNGYATGGASLANKAKSYDPNANVATLDADDVAWAGASFSCRYAAIYKSTGVAGTSPLLGYVDLGGTQTVSGGTFTITWNAAGIFTAAAA